MVMRRSAFPPDGAYYLSCSTYSSSCSIEQLREHVVLGIVSKPSLCRISAEQQRFAFHLKFCGDGNAMLLLSLCYSR